MRKLFGKRWRFEAYGSGSNAVLFGVKIFNYDWKRTGKQVTVRDPEYNREQIADVCEAVIDGENRKFAVCELHMDYYAFYLQKR